MKRLIFYYLILSISPLAFSQEMEEIILPDSICIQANAPIRDLPAHEGNLIFRTQEVIQVPIFKRYGEYLQVKFDTIIAYVSYAFIAKNSESAKDFSSNIMLESKRRLNAKKDSILREEFRLEQLENNEVFQKKMSEMVKKYGEVNGRKIAFGNIWIGMTEEMLLDSWGYPIEINRTAVAGLLKKQYVYANSRYVYVENSKVTAWQDY